MAHRRADDRKSRGHSLVIASKAYRDMVRSQSQALQDNDFEACLFEVPAFELGPERALSQSAGSSDSSYYIQTVIGSALSEYANATAVNWADRLKALPFVRVDIEAEKRFQRLVSEWKETRGYSSSTVDLAMNPAYQQIIGMGDKALPMLFRSLERDPDHWFWALKSITGADPVPEEARGNIKKMSESWLSWARRNKYHW